MDCPVLFRTKMVILQVSLGKKKSIPYLLCSSKWLRGWWGGTSYHQPVSPTAASWISMMKGIAFLRTSIIMTFCDLFALSHSWPSAIFFSVLAWRFWMQENSQALFLSLCPKGIFVAKSSFIYFFPFLELSLLFYIVIGSCSEQRIGKLGWWGSHILLIYTLQISLDSKWEWSGCG